MTLLPINWLANVIHIDLTRGLGVDELDSASMSGDDSFAMYDWSVGLSISPSILMVHDTDELASPMANIRSRRPLNLALRDTVRAKFIM